MIGASTERAPHPSVVLPHFAFSAVSFLVLAVFMFLSQNELFGHYFQGKILTLVHIAALGWINMVILGALYQLIPVVMLVSLFSERLAKISFWLYAFGIIGISHTFWGMKFNYELLANASILLLATIIFAINAILTARKAEKITIESIMTVSSVVWFLITAILGFLIALNYIHPFWNISHIEVLKVHAHAGLVGWFLMLIMGVGAVLIPMFFLSHQLNRVKLHIAFYSVNIGILFFLVDLLFLAFHLYIIPIVLVGVGIISFLSYIYESYKKRARKNLDVGLKHTVVSLILLLIPLIFALIVSQHIPVSSVLLQRSIIFYGVSIMVGFISSLILGQVYKTLPFIIWLKKYQAYVGKYKTKLPKDLYSEKLLDIQYWSYNLSIILIFTALLFNVKIVMTIGSAVLIFTALIFNINVFKMFFHKVVVEELPHLKK